MARVNDLRDARDRLWDAINGDRLLERDGPKGESYTAREPLAPLVRELRAVTRELAELDDDGEQEVSKRDDLLARREARLSGAADSASTSRRSQPRRRAGGNRTS